MKLSELSFSLKYAGTFSATLPADETEAAEQAESDSTVTYDSDTGDWTKTATVGSGTYARTVTLTYNLKQGMKQGFDLVINGLHNSSGEVSDFTYTVSLDCEAWANARCTSGEAVITAKNEAKLYAGSSSQIPVGSKTSSASSFKYALAPTIGKEVENLPATPTIVTTDDGTRYVEDSYGGQKHTIAANVGGSDVDVAYLTDQLTGAYNWILPAGEISYVKGDPLVDESGLGDFYTNYLSMYNLVITIDGEPAVTVGKVDPSSATTSWESGDWKLELCSSLPDVTPAKEDGDGYQVTDNMLSFKLTRTDGKIPAGTTIGITFALRINESSDFRNLSTYVGQKIMLEDQAAIIVQRNTGVSTQGKALRFAAKADNTLTGAAGAWVQTSYLKPANGTKNQVALAKGPYDWTIELYSGTEGKGSVSSKSWSVDDYLMHLKLTYADGTEPTEAQQEKFIELLAKNITVSDPTAEYSYYDYVNLEEKKGDAIDDGLVTDVKLKDTSFCYGYSECDDES